jgi:hypothetical protein
MLGCGIALGFTTHPLAVGDAVTIDMRGSEVVATVVDPPFVPKSS